MSDCNYNRLVMSALSGSSISVYNCMVWVVVLLKYHIGKLSSVYIHVLGN